MGDQRPYKYVGKSVPRLDALDKVTGTAPFTDDLPFGPGLLYGRVLRSPHAHAMIKSIDVSKAIDLPGVRAVATGAVSPAISALIRACTRASATGFPAESSTNPDTFAGGASQTSTSFVSTAAISTAAKF